jgi:hypothetical protein
MSALMSGNLAVGTPVSVAFKTNDLQAFVQIAVPAGGASNVTFQASMDGGVTWYDVPAQDLLLGTTLNSYPITVNGPADGSARGYFLPNLGMFANALQVVCNSGPGPAVQGRTGSFFGSLPGGPNALGGPTNIAAMLFAICLMLDEGFNTGGKYLDLATIPPTPATLHNF